MKPAILFLLNVVCLKPFTPEVEYRRFVTKAVESRSSGRKGAVAVAQKFLQMQMGFRVRDYIIKDIYNSSSNGVTHVYLRQKVDGKEVFNGDINLNIRHGTVVSYGDSFYRPKQKATFPNQVDPAPEIMTVFLGHAGIRPTSPIDVLPMDYSQGLLLKNIPGALHPPRAQLGWIQTSKDGLVPVWDLQVEFQTNYYHAHVAALRKDIVSLADWTTHSYSGVNNAIDPTNTSSLNLLNGTNHLHDLLYRYGFDEKAGNFQTDNFGRGGLGKDAVLVYPHPNNAFFTTPPDGVAPRLHMDESLSKDILIHEYCHGLSTRLTGGPSNSDCLGDGEPGGLGEGWCDFIAVLLKTTRHTNRSTDFGIGQAPTIRSYLYSTNLATNPDTYASLSTYKEVHLIGQVWAAILYEIYWNLRDKLGFNESWDSTSTTHANTLLLQLLIDAMKLQPCRPTFIDARTALLHAEHLLTNGQHSCELWSGFAKRGLGTSSSSSAVPPSYTNSYQIPDFCLD